MGQEEVGITAVDRMVGDCELPRNLFGIKKQ